MNEDTVTKRIIDDEYGQIHQRLSSRGKWVNTKRTVFIDPETPITFRLENPKTDDFLKALEAARVRLAINDMNDRLEVNGKPITDAAHSIIKNRLRDYGLRGEQRMDDAMLEAGHYNRYHPIKDYLNGLDWNGGDYFSEFIDCLTFDEKTKDIGPVFIKRFLIGSIAKIVEQGQNFMLVIDGAQDLGKSSLARWLCPLQEYFYEGASNPDDKDTHKRMMAKWLWEVGELEGLTRRSDRAALKDIITKKMIEIRVAFGRHDIKKPASASLIGTINEDGAGFLNDPTGSRRFSVFKLIAIDFRYEEIDINQLWAQLYHLYKAGEPWKLQKHEKEARRNVNNDYESISVVGELLMSCYKLDAELNQKQEAWISTAEILRTLEMAGLGGPQRSNLMQLSSELRRAGLTKKKLRGKQGFYGVVRLAEGWQGWTEKNE